jgi:DNA-binding transcriptional regulator YbjK
VPTDPLRAAPGDPSPDGRLARGAQTRRRLLDATVLLIAAEGTAAVTHRAVAARAGVSKSVATYHYPAVDDLLVAALEDCADAYARGLAAELPADCTVSELSAFLARYHNDHWARSQAGYELYLFAARRPTLRPAALRWLEVLSSLARRYTRSPEAVTAFAAVVDGLSLQALLLGEPLDPQALSRQLQHALRTSD